MLGVRDEKGDQMKRKQPVQRVYDTGMQFANALRLLGKHEEANQVEVWVLEMVRLEEANNVRKN